MEGNVRTDIIEKNALKSMKIITDKLGWSLELLYVRDRNSYVVCELKKDSVSHKYAILYSQSTEREVYESLSKEVEIIFIYGHDYKEKNFFSDGCTIPVIPSEEFLLVITDWNLEFHGISNEGYDIEKAPNKCDSKSERDKIFIVEENPLEQIYTQLRALTSKSVVYKNVEYHARKNGVDYSEQIKQQKAEGVSFLVQNAIDYYDSAATENLTQRMLNLYYGTIALMEAEMLISGNEYSKLSEIEAITKNGHGMITLGEAEDGLNDYFVGIMKRGLFPAWLEHRKIDVSRFPDTRKKVEKSNEFYISLNTLLYSIPELENILLEIDDKFKPRYMFPTNDMSMNYTSLHGKTTYYKRKFYGNYVNLIDETGRANESLVNELLEKALLIGPYKDKFSDSKGWKVFVQTHKDGKYFEEYNTHKGLSVSMIMAPVLGLSSEWDIYAVMILYTLSIIVRYMPNLWTRINHGDLDRYKAVIYQFSRVAERELTQIFLEKLTGKRVVIRHPQSLI